MMELSEFTARLVRALASCVSRFAMDEATVASATVACPAAASSEIEVALLVTPFNASTACPRMLLNEPDAATEETGAFATLDAAAPATADDTEGIGGIAGITTTP